MTLAFTVPPARAGEPKRPPVGVPSKLTARWAPALVETPDVANGGAPLRGLAGRAYLFDDRAGPAITRGGELIVDLYDDRPLATGGQPVRLERWVFPDAILRRLTREDATGWGYTLFLPWVTTYRPDISPVHLRLCFSPKGGSPLYANSPSLALQPPSHPLAMTREEPRLLASGNTATIAAAVKKGLGPDDVQVAEKVGGHGGKVCYVIADKVRSGQTVYTFPITGGETVLDAIASSQDLPPVVSKCSIWVARLSPEGGESPQILPVDWLGITSRGEFATNHALRPGDRIYVAPPFPEMPRHSCVVDPLERARAAVAECWRAWGLLSR
jgi:hypothetical protein